MKKLPIILTLSGGLGNQLFQYSAGLFIETHLSRSIVYNIVNLKKNPISKPGNYTRRLEIAELFSGNDTINKKIPIRPDLPIRYFRRLNQPESILIESGPTDDVLQKITDDTTAIYGYFQSAEMVEKVWESLKENMKHSDEFKDLINPKKSDRICIHLRFGDYSDDAKTRATHGLTSRSYYENAVSQFTLTNSKIRELLVITDDVKKAVSFIDESFPKLNVDFKSSKHPMQDLKEIASSTYVVMSNSTFSWWGAWFAYKAHGAQILYPRPWFADERDIDLPIYNPRWKFIKRDFLNY